MNLDSTLTMDPKEAKEKAAEYRQIKVPSEEDRRIIAIFTAMAAGKQVIDLHRAVTDAGLNEKNLPRLAAMSVSRPWCYLYAFNNGKMEFRPTNSGRSGQDRIEIERIPGLSYCYGNVRSQVPIVPPRHRKWGYKGMIVAWEVEEWARSPRPPGDPILLKPLLGALYTVEATWDLTEVEKLVLAQRQ